MWLSYQIVRARVLWLSYARIVYSSVMQPLSNKRWEDVLRVAMVTKSHPMRRNMSIMIQVVDESLSHVLKHEWVTEPRTIWKLDKIFPLLGSMSVNERASKRASKQTRKRGSELSSASKQVSGASGPAIDPRDLVQTFRFFHISSRRNIVLGDNFPWMNMDWLIKSKHKVLSMRKFSGYLVIVKTIKLRHSKGHISRRNHDRKLIFMQK